MRRNRGKGTWRATALLATAILWACGGEGAKDAGGDTAADLAQEATADVPVEAGEDLPGDLTQDATPETTADEAVGEGIEDTSGPGPESITLASGGYSLKVDRVAMRIELARGADVLAVLDAAALQLGRVDELDDATNYDPWPIQAQVTGYDPPWGLAWLDVTAMAIGAHDEDSAEVRLAYGDAKDATLSIRVQAAGRVRFLLKPEAAGDDVAYLRVRPIADPNEAFYGLGAYLDQVNHRGMVRAMQLEMDDRLEGNYNEAHVPVPFVIGTRGWGLFVASRYPGSFDVAKAQVDRVDAVFGTGLDSTGGLEFYLFGAEMAIDVTRHYYAVTGAPRLPARWALGPWVWRDEIPGQVEVEADLDKIRELDLATTGYWIDRPYANGVNSFDFHDDRYSDPQAMIDKAHALGFRMALWHTPYVSYRDETCQETEALRAGALSGGYFPPTVGVEFNKWGEPIDFTNPAAYSWWQALIRRYTDMGIEGFKLDYAEDVVPGMLGMRVVWKFFDGSDERTMHSLYKTFYHRVYNETLPADGGFLLCRAGTWGDQVNVSVIWPGDLDANLSLHGDPIDPQDGNGKVFVGGLPASLAYDLNLGPSGFPFFGADTGGYRHSPPDRETFMRWYQQTALTSVMQVGTSSNDVAWEFRNPDGSDDTELLDNYREYTRLHLRLFPYEWTYATQLAATGRPISRALGLVHPELGVHPADTYFFGDDLLVAPVVTRGATSREVVLPQGTWYHWFTGAAYEGGRTVTIPAPPTRLTLLLRKGSVVPMLRPTIDAIAPTTRPDLVDSYATTPGVLWARVYPGDASTFRLFDGAQVGQAQSGTTITLTTQDGDEFRSGTMFEVVAVVLAPASVKEGAEAYPAAGSLADLQSQEMGWFHDASSGTLYVKAAPGEHQVTVSTAARAARRTSL